MVRVAKTASKMSSPLFTEETIREGVAKYGTPFWLYDRSTIEKRVQELKCFDTVRFAQKACPNLSIISIVRKAGALVDAVSAGEIVRALRAGYKGGESDKQVPQIVYSADIFDRDAIELVKKHNIHVNVGSADMIKQLADAGVRSNLTLRVNPGFGHGHSKKTNLLYQVKKSQYLEIT